MSLLLQQAAAESAKREKKRKTPESSPAVLAVPSPEGVVKTSASGRQYRVITIPLMDLPRFLEENKLEPKTYFYYLPESDWFLGVKKRGEPEEREL